MGKTLCCSLPAFHALTGSDYTSAFCRKGKIKPLKYLEKDHVLQAILGTFGKGQEVDDEMYSAAEKLACMTYGNRTIERVDDLR